MAKIKPEFDRRDVKIIGLSVDPIDNHEKWADDIEETQGAAPNYPIIGDADFSVSKLYGMLAADVSGDPADRTPADNQTVRNVFVIGPDKKVKLILVYPMTTGRNFDEVLRVIDSLQLTAKHKVSTPVNWQQGEDVIIAGSVSDDEAKEIFGELGVAEAVHPDRAAAVGGAAARPGGRVTSGRHGLGHDVGLLAATFTASFVEFVEALTIVLAMGVTRGWRSALAGAARGVGRAGRLHGGRRLRARQLAAARRAPARRSARCC